MLSVSRVCIKSEHPHVKQIYILAQADKDFMLKEFMEIEKVTCIRFDKYNPLLISHKDYIEIINAGDGQCWSLVGRAIEGGKQELSLGLGCLATGVLQHEGLHALGIMHTQSRVDRDTYIRILVNNIQPGMEHNFDKVVAADFDNFGVAYDLQ